MNWIRRRLAAMRKALSDESQWRSLQFTWVYRILTVVSVFMSLVNVLTGKWLLLGSTLVFAVLCFANLLLAKAGERALRVSTWIFTAEILALLIFFIVTGTPEGFSAIWVCLVPAFGLLLFHRRYGSILCAGMFRTAALLF